MTRCSTLFEPEERTNEEGNVSHGWERVFRRALEVLTRVSYEKENEEEEGKEGRAKGQLRFSNEESSYKLDRAITSSKMDLAPSTLLIHPSRPPREAHSSQESKKENSLPFIEEIRPRSSQINNLRAPIPILL